MAAVQVCVRGRISNRTAERVTKAKANTQCTHLDLRKVAATAPKAAAMDVLGLDPAPSSIRHPCECQQKGATTLHTGTVAAEVIDSKACINIQPSPPPPPPPHTLRPCKHADASTQHAWLLPLTGLGMNNSVVQCALHCLPHKHCPHVLGYPSLPRPHCTPPH